MEKSVKIDNLDNLDYENDNNDNKNDNNHSNKDNANEEDMKINDLDAATTIQSDEISVGEPIILTLSNEENNNNDNTDNKENTDFEDKYVESSAAIESSIISSVKQPILTTQVTQSIRDPIIPFDSRIPPADLRYLILKNLDTGEEFLIGIITAFDKSY